MKVYNIKRINEETVIAFSTSIKSPSDAFKVIKNDLKKRGFNGVVYFDYLLSNGNNMNRFAKAFFNGIDFRHFQIISKEEVAKDGNLLENVKNFYKENYEKYVQNSSILLPAIKFRIKKGLNI